LALRSGSIAELNASKEKPGNSKNPKTCRGAAALSVPGSSTAIPLPPSRNARSRIVTPENPRQANLAFRSRHAAGGWTGKAF
jgi:hypothetical protein